MAWKKININKYVSEVKKNMNLGISDEIIVKDLLLTLVLAEFEKEKEVFSELVFKGGTLLSRHYLNYHRFSEDLDFVYKKCKFLRDLSRNQREKQIKKFIDVFVPKLKNVSDELGIEFDIDRSNTKFCTILNKRAIYIFRLYYDGNNFIKIEINFVEKLLYEPTSVSVKAITDYFDSKELFFILGLSYKNFNVLCYSIDEIVLEKYRALLTRPTYKERDLFDLFLIKDSLKVDKKKVIEKIKASSLIKKNLNSLVKTNLNKLKNDEYFFGYESAEDLAIVEFDKNKFEMFKEKIKSILIDICEEYVNDCGDRDV